MEIRQLLTFDDVLLIPRVSNVSSRKEVDTTTQLTEKIKLSIPIMSSNMDTVTESQMAIAMARMGGVGAIHRFNTIEKEAEEVSKVKREQNVIISQPYVVAPEFTLKQLKELIHDKGVSSFPVLKGKKLVGIITKRDFQFETDDEKRVEEMMTHDVITAKAGTSIDEAKKILLKNKKEKLPLVDSNNNLVGMITAKDIKMAESYGVASKDKQGRLIVGGSIGIGSDYLQRTDALITAGADFIVVDVANGYLEKTANVVKTVKKKFGVEVIAGNIATKEGVLNLKKAGADCVKIGIGPGGACLTRPVAGVGYPQLSAIMECAKNGIPVIADGGIQKSADLSKAIAAGASVAMIGGLFAGTDESPGVIVTKSSTNYKFYRGMASIDAFSDKSLRTNETADLEGYTPEGTETLVPYRGSVTKIVTNLVGGVKSAMTYLNSRNLEEFRKNAQFVKLTEAGKKESKYL
ncbi:MAG: IMP dehydrogenase [Candidatus Parvarchaeota archaeon]|jgi:IMP dehydrogenase|nr:IMP dehydrogenase [Candidatus Parvarchaeota archaeon]MCL5101693.1 IMP dehydrogenase [Candidatus Parvarchaeota archaeon]